MSIRSGDWPLSREIQIILLFGERYRGKFDVRVMMDVPDTDIENGGPSGDFTRLKVVAIPREKELWMKIPKYQNWTEIDHKDLFRDNLPAPEVLAVEIVESLETALREFRAIYEELGSSEGRAQWRS
ncbi:MAG: hypothetical protein PHN61_14575 [Methanothrix sp.]|nr:hypothetical protein [Methanothrix sp.]